MRSGSEKVPDWDAIDMVPLVSWLPDVPSQTYTGVGLQPGTISCLIVLTVSLPHVQRLWVRPDVTSET